MVNVGKYTIHGLFGYSNHGGKSHGRKVRKHEKNEQLKPAMKPYNNQTDKHISSKRCSTPFLQLGHSSTWRMGSQNGRISVVKNHG